jgi:hypothetical protein
MPVQPAGTRDAKQALRVRHAKSKVGLRIPFAVARRYLRYAAQTAPGEPGPSFNRAAVIAAATYLQHRIVRRIKVASVLANHQSARHLARMGGNGGKGHTAVLHAVDLEAAAAFP